MNSPAILSNPPRPTASYRHLVFAGLFMLTGLCLLIYLGSDRRRVVGQPVFDLDLAPLLHTETGFQPEKNRGKLVLLHFWGPWCPPCRAEYPRIQKLNDQYADPNPLQIASVACAAIAPDDLPQLRRDTLDFLQGEPQYPIYCDPAEYSRVRIAKLLGQRGFSYPTTLLLDTQGQILDYWVRPTDPGELDRAIDRAIRSAMTPSRKGK